MHIYGRGISEYVFVTAVKNGGTLFTCGHENQFLPFFTDFKSKTSEKPGTGSGAGDSFAKAFLRARRGLAALTVLRCV